MHQSAAFEPLLNDIGVAQGVYEIYVVSSDLQVLLKGSDPNDLAPAANVEGRLPYDIDRAVRSLIEKYDFSNKSIARTSTGRKSLRVMLIAGPAGNFYGVVCKANRPRPREYVQTA